MQRMSDTSVAKVAWRALAGALTRAGADESKGCARTSATSCDTTLTSQFSRKTEVGGRMHR
eukprot:1146110-Rhodomonas_salina.2